MVNVIEFTDTDALIAKFDEMKTSGNFFLCYFTGGIDPGTGASWCGDCVAA